MARRPARAGSGRRPRAAAALAVLSVLAAGCAAVPVSGRVQQAQNTAGQAADYPQTIPVRPQADWTPQEIVQGFLQASASGFNNQHAAARQYLAPALRSKWRPSWAVTVVSGKLSLNKVAVQNTPVGGPNAVNVIASGQRLATLTATGQYQVSSATKSYLFGLQENKQSHIWQIVSLPPALLLTKPDFITVYRAHDLYFASPSGRVLVPDPVFLPQTGTPQQLARVLVSALLVPPSGLLADAADTRFPPRTTLLTPHAVSLAGTVLTVNLGGAAARTSRATREAMAAQLVYTLAVPSATAPAIAQSVVMKINGTIQHLYPQPYQSLSGYDRWLTGSGWLPAPPPAQLYFLKDGKVYQDTPGAAHPVPAPGAAGAGQFALTAIAARPDGRALAGIGTARTRHGKAKCVVYSGLTGRRGQVVKRDIPIPGSCTSVSYDAEGDLWVADGGFVYLLPPGTAPPQQVAVDGLPNSWGVSQLRVASDGLRVALIARRPDGSTQVDVGPIVREATGPQIARTVTVADNVDSPWQLAWYGSDDILVLSQSGSQLWEAPVNGGGASQITPQPGMSWLASNGRTVAVEADGNVLASDGPDTAWNQVGQGGQPALAGG